MEFRNTAAALAMLAASGAALAEDAAPQEAVLVITDTLALKAPEEGMKSELPQGLHLAETRYVSGDGWWALSCAESSCSIQAETLVVQPMEHPSYDADPVPGQFLSWKPQPPKDTVMMFKPQPAGRMPQLKAGTVTTWMAPSEMCVEASNDDLLHTTIVLDEGNTACLTPRLILKAANPDEGDGDVVRIELRAYGKRQLLPDSYEWHMESGHPLKKWAASDRRKKPRIERGLL